MKCQGLSSVQCPDVRCIVSDSWHSPDVCFPVTGHRMSVRPHQVGRSLRHRVQRLWPKQLQWCPRVTGQTGQTEAAILFHDPAAGQQERPGPLQVRARILLRSAGLYLENKRVVWWTFGWTEPRDSKRIPPEHTSDHVRKPRCLHFVGMWRCEP